MIVVIQQATWTHDLSLSRLTQSCTVVRSSSYELINPTPSFLFSSPLHYISIQTDPNPRTSSFSCAAFFFFFLLLLSVRNMARFGYLKMKTDAASEAAMQQLIDADLNDLGVAARKLANHALVLGAGATFLKFLASVAAIYLLILDRTNWRTNMLTALLVPYIFLSLPSVIFNVLRAEVGLWFSFIAVILRLFFPRHFPDWLEMPGSLLLLLVVAPGFFAYTIRVGELGWIGLVICLIIGCYLLQEHIRASGGFRNSFTQSHGISNTIGLILLLVYPIWSLVVLIL